MMIQVEMSPGAVAAPGAGEAQAAGEGGFGTILESLTATPAAAQAAGQDADAGADFAAPADQPPGAGETDSAKAPVMALVAAWPMDADQDELPDEAVPVQQNGDEMAPYRLHPLRVRHAAAGEAMDDADPSAEGDNPPAAHSRAAVRDGGPAAAAQGRQQAHEPEAQPRTQQQAGPQPVRAVAADPPGAAAADDRLAGQHAADASAAEKPATAAQLAARVEIPDTTNARGAAPAMHAARTAAPSPVPAEVQFAEANLSRIVTHLRSELLPGGGTMQIRLDPPELGAMQVSVRMIDGAMTASFQTSSDAAAQLLSHNLHQLKSVLESQGITVERLQVQQSPREQQPAGSGEQEGQQQDPHDQSRHDQQRREMLQRMWRKLALWDEPLDLVA